jgi:hypothetical protein
MRYNPIVWDLNMCFGGFPYVGSGGTGMGGLTPTQMQQLSVTAHQGDAYWPLLNSVYNNAQFKRMYIAHMRTLLNENVANSAYQNLAVQLQNTADTAVNSDPNKFFTYSQFQNAMNTNYTVATYTVPGISNLMTSRLAYLQGTTDFTAVPPVIGTCTANPSAPGLGTNVNMTASVSNANNVYFAYRSYTYQNFTKITMYDDGMHNDGAAGDNVYGCNFTMSSNQMEYYVYAENANAGIFSPERAEHEFFILSSGTAGAGPGSVTINEYLAINQNDAIDENGAHADWIEFFNNTNANVSMNGLYLSDDPSNKTKFAFPANAVIAPYSYLIVWADEGISTATHIHANFKLSSAGEYIILSNGSGITLDSMYFAAQVADVSEGRCPNGTGPVTTLGITSFGFANCALGIHDQNENDNHFSVYPNPAGDFLNIKSILNEEQLYEIFNLQGQKILSGNFTTFHQVSVSELSPGIYSIRCSGKTRRFVIYR